MAGRSYFPTATNQTKTKIQMKHIIELPVSELKTALAGLGKVVNRRSALPVLAHLRVSRDATGQVALQGTDLDSTATYKLSRLPAG